MSNIKPPGCNPVAGLHGMSWFHVGVIVPVLNENVFLLQLLATQHWMSLLGTLPN